MNDFKLVRKLQKQGKNGYSLITTIPAEIKRFLKLEAGDSIGFSINENNQVEITKE